MVIEESEQTVMGERYPIGAARPRRADELQREMRESRRECREAETG